MTRNRKCTLASLWALMAIAALGKQMVQYVQVSTNRSGVVNLRARAKGRKMMKEEEKPFDITTMTWDDLPLDPTAKGAVIFVGKGIGVGALAAVGASISTSNPLYGVALLGFLGLVSQLNFADKESWQLPSSPQGIVDWYLGTGEGGGGPSALVKLIIGIACLSGGCAILAFLYIYFFRFPFLAGSSVGVGLAAFLLKAQQLLSQPPTPVKKKSTSGFFGFGGSNDEPAPEEKSGGFSLFGKGKDPPKEKKSGGFQMPWNKGNDTEGGGGGGGGFSMSFMGGGVEKKEEGSSGMFSFMSDKSEKKDGGDEGGGGFPFLGGSGDKKDE